MTYMYTSFGLLYSCTLYYIKIINVLVSAVTAAVASGCSFTITQLLRSTSLHISSSKQAPRRQSRVVSVAGVIGVAFHRLCK